MNLEWTGQEAIPIGRTTVWEFINDPANIAACLPGVRETKVRDAKSFDAVVRAKVGPLRGSLTFKVHLQPAADGSCMDISIGGGGLGSVVDMLASAALVVQDESTTTLSWKCSASMRGPVASMGRRVLDAQGQRLIGTTFENVRKRLSGEA